MQNIKFNLMKKEAITKQQTNNNLKYICYNTFATFEMNYRKFILEKLFRNRTT